MDNTLIFKFRRNFIQKNRIHIIRKRCLHKCSRHIKSTCCVDEINVFFKNYDKALQNMYMKNRYSAPDHAILKIKILYA